MSIKSKTYLAGTCSSILTIWSTQSRRRMLHRWRDHKALYSFVNENHLKRTEMKILLLTFRSNFPRAIESILNSIHAFVPCKIAERISDERGLCFLIPYGVTIFGKSNFIFNLQADIILTSNGGNKLSKLVHNIEGIVLDLNLEFEISHIPIWRQHILCVALVHCHAYINRFAFDCTKGYSNNAAAEHCF